MKLKHVVAASLLAFGTAASQASVLAPGGDFGSLGAASELFGGLVTGGTFSDDFYFTLDGTSSVTGSVAEFFGDVSFSAVALDGAAALLTATTTGYSFSFANLAAGDYVLTVTGSSPVGLNAYAGSLMAQPVPEPQSVAMLLAGLGLMGAVATRRRRGF
jgi:hypothetical protein